MLIDGRVVSVQQTLIFHFNALDVVICTRKVRAELITDKCAMICGVCCLPIACWICVARSKWINRILPHVKSYIDV